MNAELTSEDRFYEWLLSDHPGAVLERARRDCRVAGRAIPAAAGRSGGQHRRRAGRYRPAGLGDQPASRYGSRLPVSGPLPRRPGAHQPIPLEPGARLHDPEERPALGDRTVKELEAENSPFAFIRTQAIISRGRAALQRTYHHQPARQTRNDHPRIWPHRDRGDRQEAERER